MESSVLATYTLSYIYGAQTDLEVSKTVQYALRNKTNLDIGCQESVKFNISAYISSEKINLPMPMRQP